MSKFHKPAHAVTVRTGFEYERSFTVTEFERCEVLSSGTSTVSGKSCKDALRLDKGPEELRQGYFKVYDTYRGKRNYGDTVPGAELSLGLEGIGQDTVMVGAMVLNQEFQLALQLGNG